MDLTPYRRRIRSGWFVVLLPLSLSGADDQIDKVGKVATEWVKTRAETVRLETEWTGQRALMGSLLDALGQRARLAEEKRESVQARTAQDREELGTLGKKNETASTSLQASEARLKELAIRVVALRPFLPPRLSTALDLSYRSLADPANSVSDRMQHTMVVLNRCLQFNHLVTSGEEVLALPGEPAPKSLEVIYWGLSHGYALDRAAAKAWLGSPGSQGWQWEPHPEAADEVARLIAIANDKSDPGFVLVPAKLGHPNR